MGEATCQMLRHLAASSSHLCHGPAPPSLFVSCLEAGQSLQHPGACESTQVVRAGGTKSVGSPSLCYQSRYLHC